MSSILAQIKSIQDRNDRELELGYVTSPASWHEEFKNSAFIHFSGFPNELNEGDALLVFSEFGEPIDLKLVRDDVTGKSKGFGFLAYEDQRSTVLAVDNLNGAELLGKKIKVGHTKNYWRKLEEGESEFGEPFLLKELYGGDWESIMKGKKKMILKGMKKLKRRKTKRAKRKKKLEKKKEKRELEDLDRKIRMQIAREHDNERRKMKTEGESGEQSLDDQYQIAYGYGAKMNVKDSQYDLKDLKVMQYERYQREVEESRAEKERKEMEEKNRRLDEYERKMDRKMEKFREQSEKQFGDGGRREKRNGGNNDNFGSRRKKRKRHGENDHMRQAKRSKKE